MAYGLSDIVQQRRMIDQIHRLRRFQARLDRQARRAGWLWPRRAQCRRKRLLAYFGETVTAESCGNCDNCLTPPKMREEQGAGAETAIPASTAPASVLAPCI